MGNVVAPLWAECPACTRLVIVGYPALSVLMALLSQVVSYRITYFLFSCSVETVMHLCVWTLFLSGFYRAFSGGFSFLMMLFEIYMALMYFPAKERDFGSTTFLLWICLMNGCVNVIFLVVMFVLSLAMDGYYQFMPNQGLWPLIMICITVNCLSNPNGATSFWGLVSIPNKWYPIALMAFFSLLQQAVLWNLVAALVIGYGYTRLRPERLLPSRVWTTSLEQRCCGERGRPCLGGSWVRACDTVGYDAESGDRRYSTLTDFGRNQSQEASGAAASGSGSASGSSARNFVAFAGSGNRLGEAGETEPMQPTVEVPPVAEQELQPTAPPADTSEGAERSEP